MRRFMGSFAVLSLMSLTAWELHPSEAQAKSSAEAKIWLSELQNSEQLVSAALQQMDGGEMKVQSVALSKIMGRLPNDLSSVDDIGRMDCAMAAQSLFNVTLDVKLSPARAQVTLQQDSSDFHKAMPKCEKAVAGRSSKRQLPR